MKKTLLFIFLLAIFYGCDRDIKETEPFATEPIKLLQQVVETYAGGSPVYTYDYTYTDENNLLLIVKTDINGDTLLKKIYTGHNKLIREDYYKKTDGQWHITSLNYKYYYARGYVSIIGDYEKARLYFAGGNWIGRTEVKRPDGSIIATSEFTWERYVCTEMKYTSINGANQTRKYYYFKNTWNPYYQENLGLHKDYRGSARLCSVRYLDGNNIYTTQIIEQDGYYILEVDIISKGHKFLNITYEYE